MRINQHLIRDYTYYFDKYEAIFPHILNIFTKRKTLYTKSISYLIRGKLWLF